MQPWRLEPLAAYLAALAALLPPILASPLVPGIDGPYYVVQVRWLLAHGCLKYPDPPLVFVELALLRLALDDDFLAVKAGSAALTALAAVPAYLLVKRLTGSRTSAAISAVAIAVNPYTVRLYSDFIKNAAGLAWLFSFLYFNTKYVEEGSRADLAAALASLALAVLTHILDYAAVLFYALATAAALAAHGEARRAAPTAAAAAASLALLFAAPQVVGGDVYKGIALLRQLALQPYPPQARWTPLAVGASAALAVEAYALRKRPAASALAAASAVFAVIVNLPIAPSQWIRRLSLMTCVPLSISLGLAAGKRPRPALAVALAALLLAATLPAMAAIRPSIPPPAYPELRAAIGRAQLLGLTPVVPNTGLRYWAETVPPPPSVQARPEPGRPFCLILLKAPSPLSARQIPPWPRVYQGRFVVALAPPRYAPRP